MKIQLTKRDIESAISTASICMSSGTDIFSHFIFRIEDNEFQILASNGRSGVVVPVITTSLEGDGSFAVEGWRIKQWLSGVDNSVLNFEMDGKKLSVKSDRGTLTFRCADTKDFPFWDSSWSQVSNYVEIDSEFFIRALNHVKSFVAADRDTDAPELSVCETFGETLGATNTNVMALVLSKVFEEVKMRVHGKDISTLVKYLSSTKKEPVKVYSTDTEFFVERQDGAVFVVARPPHEMIKRPISENSDFKVSFDRKNFESTMTSLLATANKEDDRMSISFGDDLITLSVESETGTNSVTLSATVIQPCEDLPSLISFSPSLLLKAAEKLEKEEISLEIVLLKKDGVLRGGLFRVKEEENDATFSVILIWKV